MGEKVITSFIYPPIPNRDHDWVAYLDGHEEEGPFGWGMTEIIAMIRLEEMLDEQDS